MKIQKTFTIEENIWIEFDKIAKKEAWNKSLLIENHLKEMIHYFSKKTKKKNEMDKR